MGTALNVDVDLRVGMLVGENRGDEPSGAFEDGEDFRLLEDEDSRGKVVVLKPFTNFLRWKL